MSLARKLASIAQIPILTVALALGCGGGGGGSEISVKLTVDGAPLDGAEVELHPAGDGAAGNYLGKSKADGALELRPQVGGKRGVAPGKYKVTIVRNQVVPGAKVPDAVKNDPDQLRAMGLTANSLPARFADVKQTPLTLDVKTGANPPVTLDVTTK